MQDAPQSESLTNALEGDGIVTNIFYYVWRYTLYVDGVAKEKGSYEGLQSILQQRNNPSSANSVNNATNASGNGAANAQASPNPNRPSQRHGGLLSKLALEAREREKNLVVPVKQTSMFGFNTTSFSGDTTAAGFTSPRRDTTVSITAPSPLAHSNSFKDTFMTPHRPSVAASVNSQGGGGPSPRNGEGRRKGRGGTAERSAPSKASANDHATRNGIAFPVILPATVIIEQNYPKAWYNHMDDDDVTLPATRRLGKDIDTSHVLREFLAETEHADDVHNLLSQHASATSTAVLQKGTSNSQSAGGQQPPRGGGFSGPAGHRYSSGIDMASAGFASVGGMGGGGARSQATSVAVEKLFREKYDDGKIVAAYFCNEMCEREKCVSVEYLDGNGLRELLTARSDRPAGFIQKFAPPCGPNNTVIQVVWSPSSYYFTRRLNKYSYTDTRVPMYERALTFEGDAAASHYCSETEVAPHIRVHVTSFLQDFVQYLWSVHSIALKRLVMHFKMDHESRLWFLWASSTRTNSTALINASLRFVPNTEVDVRVTDREKNNASQQQKKRSTSPSDALTATASPPGVNSHVPRGGVLSNSPTERNRASLVSFSPLAPPAAHTAQYQHLFASNHAPPSSHMAREESEEVVAFPRPVVQSPTAIINASASATSRPHTAEALQAVRNRRRFFRMQTSLGASEEMLEILSENPLISLPTAMDVSRLPREHVRQRMRYLKNGDDAREGRHNYNDNTNNQTSGNASVANDGAGGFLSRPNTSRSRSVSPFLSGGGGVAGLGSGSRSLPSSPTPKPPSSALFSALPPPQSSSDGIKSPPLAVPTDETSLTAAHNHSNVDNNVNATTATNVIGLSAIALSSAAGDDVSAVHDLTTVVEGMKSDSSPTATAKGSYAASTAPRESSTASATPQPLSGVTVGAADAPTPTAAMVASDSPRSRASFAHKARRGSLVYRLGAAGSSFGHFRNGSGNGTRNRSSSNMNSSNGAANAMNATIGPEQDASYPTIQPLSRSASSLWAAVRVAVRSGWVGDFYALEMVEAWLSDTAVYECYSMVKRDVGANGPLSSLSAGGVGGGGRRVTGAEGRASVASVSFMPIHSAAKNSIASVSGMHTTALQGSSFSPSRSSCNQQQQQHQPISSQCSSDFFSPADPARLLSSVLKPTNSIKLFHDIPVGAIAKVAKSINRLRGPLVTSSSSPSLQREATGSMSTRREATVAASNACRLSRVNGAVSSGGASSAPSQRGPREIVSSFPTVASLVFGVQGNATGGGDVVSPPPSCHSLLSSLPFPLLNFVLRDFEDIAAWAGPTEKTTRMSGHGVSSRASSSASWSWLGSVALCIHLLERLGLSFTVPIKRREERRSVAFMNAPLPRGDEGEEEGGTATPAAVAVASAAGGAADDDLLPPSSSGFDAESTSAASQSSNKCEGALNATQPAEEATPNQGTSEAPADALPAGRMSTNKASHDADERGDGEEADGGASSIRVINSPFEIDFKTMCDKDGAKPSLFSTASLVFNGFLRPTADVTAVAERYFAKEVTAPLRHVLLWELVAQRWLLSQRLSFSENNNELSRTAQLSGLTSSVLLPSPPPPPLPTNSTNFIPNIPSTGITDRYGPRSTAGSIAVSFGGGGGGGGTIAMGSYAAMMAADDDSNAVSALIENSSLTGAFGDMHTSITNNSHSYCSAKLSTTAAAAAAAADTSTATAPPPPLEGANQDGEEKKVAAKASSSSSSSSPAPSLPATVATPYREDTVEWRNTETEL